MTGGCRGARPAGERGKEGDGGREEGNRKWDIENVALICDLLKPIFCCKDHLNLLVVYMQNRLTIVPLQHMHDLKKA